MTPPSCYTGKTIPGNNRTGVSYVTSAHRRRTHQPSPITVTTALTDLELTEIKSHRAPLQGAHVTQAQESRARRLEACTGSTILLMVLVRHGAGHSTPSCASLHLGVRNQRGAGGTPVKPPNQVVLFPS